MTSPSSDNIPRTVALKEPGRSAHIRRAIVEDIDDLWRLERAVIEDGRGVVRTMDDLAPLNGFRARLAKRLHKPETETRGVLLVAVDPPTGLLMSIGEVWRLGPTLIRHVGSLSLEVHPRFQGLGVGRATLTAMLDWAIYGGGASAPHPIRRLELTVRGDNVRAQHLYRKVGFTRESVRKGFVRTPDGTLVDDWMMVRFFER
ncbi:MAG: GNAT family N-acetyltransferase [Myxococcota bacterium]